MQALHKLVTLSISLALCGTSVAAGKTDGKTASSSANSYSFALLPFPHSSEAVPQWQQKLRVLDAAALAFVVVNGVKAANQPCGDQIYQQHRSWFDDVENGVVVNLAAQDWSDCQKSDGYSNAVERLTRLRELFFSDEFSLGKSRIELSRQSLSPKFRNYPENARWEINGVLFATIHLPADNNRFLAAAGRNSEFEDRQVANRDWLKKLFAFANLKKERAVVLIADGSLMGASYAQSGKLRSPGNERFRDGFADLQQRLLNISENYAGKILLIDHSGKSDSPSNIIWRGKFGLLSLPTKDMANGYIVQVSPAKGTFFNVKTLK